MSGFYVRYAGARIEKKMETRRLIIEPMTTEETDKMISQYKISDPELSQAYEEMLTGCLAYPEQYLWYVPWKICLIESGTFVGDICFKGLPESGQPEIGYGILEAYQRNGYATEAVSAMCQWAFMQEGVEAVEAETAPDNEASQKVLLKTGFHPTGVMGEEGPRFILKRVK